MISIEDNFFSSDREIQKRIEQSLEGNILKREGLVTVFYLPEVEEYFGESISEIIEGVALISTKKNIIIQNKKVIKIKDYLSGEIPSLLTPEDRRIARKKTICSYNKMYGSFDKSGNLSIFRNPFDVIIVTASKPDFSVDYLEYQDFVITKSSKHFNPKSEDQAQITRRETILLPFLIRDWYENIFLILTSFDRMVKKVCDFTLEEKKGILRIELGNDYFVNGEDISDLIESIFFDSLEEVLSRNRFDRISIIEFEDSFVELREFPIILRKVKTHRGFSASDRRDYHLGLLYFSDPFAIPGNERKGQNIENTTDIRYFQNYKFNPKIFNNFTMINVE